MNVETLPSTKITHWLAKTCKSISNCPGSSDMETNYRKNMLCIRYDELKAKAKVAGVWESYCLHTGFDPSHDGYDLAA